MDIAYDSYHGSLIEQYFVRKNGRFEPIHRAVSTDTPGLFLCFTNRCGSTLIAAESSALGFCGKPNNHLNYEFFNSDFVIEYCEQNAIRSFQHYVESLYEEFRSPLDIFFSKGSLDQLAWMRRCGVIGVAVPNYNYIRVIRRDIVAQAISFVIAEQTGQWTTIHQPSSTTPSYDHQRIASTVSYFAKIAADTDIYFSILNAQPTYFIYEDVLTDLVQIGQRLESVTGLRALARGPRTLDVQKQAQGINVEWAQRFRQEVIDASAQCANARSA